MSLAIQKILFTHEKSKLSSSISFSSETGNACILSEDPSFLTTFAHAISGIESLEGGAIFVGDTILRNKKGFSSNKNIAFVSNDWSFLKRLNMLEIIKLCYSVFVGSSKIKLPTVAQKNIRQRFVFTQLLLADAPLWIFNQLDFSENKHEWLFFLNSFKNSKSMLFFSENGKNIEEICDDVMILHDSIVIDSGKTKDLLDELKYIVWEKNIEQNDLEKYEDAFYILKQEVIEDKIRINVLSEKKPCDEFIQVKPNLEILFKNKIVLANLASQK